MFVAALVEDGIVTATQILGRIDNCGIEWPDAYDADRDVALGRARNWLADLEKSGDGRG
ncbi:hypothetical protein [Rhodococcus jostii]|uniref:hypothetical protein n=1 Tax=Rhodococcus jostii TaxID=132919 RepID=UPI0036672883